MVGLWRLGLLLMMLTLAVPADAKGPLVLAPSSMQDVLGRAADQWASDGHDRPVLSFAGTGALARQVESGAAADIFISADAEWMAHVAARGRLAPGTRATIAGNRLVVVRRTEADGPNRLENGRALLRALGQDRLAVADPASVPAGRYAEAGLRDLGIWPQVEPRLVRAENVRAALALVERGAAPLGIVYASDARASAMVRRIASFPENSHPPIVYPAALLRASTHPGARPFLKYLRSQEARKLFVAHGFTVPAR